MRIILKIIAAPFMLALTITVAVLSFLLSLSAGVLSVLAFVLGGAGVLMLAVQGDMFNGIALLVMGFAISPFGLPARLARSRRRLFLAAAILIERGNAHGHNTPYHPPCQQGGNHRAVHAGSV